VPGNNGRPILRLVGVTKEYGQGEMRVKALQGIDLTLEPKAFVAVAGPSGSGKSTLLNIIGGLDRPTTGLVEVDGNALAGMSAHRLSRLRMERIGFIFQAFNLIPVLTALENAEYVLMLQGVAAARRRAIILELFKEVGLEGLAHRYPRELSGGQQQRVAIVRAIASAPALVLADEPTANVDSTTGGAIMDLMAELNRLRDITFVFATHDPNVMARAQVLIKLKDGRIESRARTNA